MEPRLRHKVMEECGSIYPDQAYEEGLGGEVIDVKDCLAAGISGDMSAARLDGMVDMWLAYAVLEMRMRNLPWASLTGGEGRANCGCVAKSFGTNRCRWYRC